MADPFASPALSIAAAQKGAMNLSYFLRARQNELTVR